MRGWCVVWRATTAFAAAVPFSCVRGAGGRPGGSSLFPLSRPAFAALCVAGRPVWGSRTLARWYAIPFGQGVPRAWSGCPSGIPRVSFACACARALVASAPLLPPWVGVAHAPRVVPVQGAGRAVPRGPCPSACPASLPRAVWPALGGGAPVLFPPCLAWGCVSPYGRACASGAFRHRGGAGGGGGAVCRPPRRRGGKAPRGGGSLYLGPSLCLPWAGTKVGVIGVAQFMEGVESILLRSVFAC